MGLVLRLCTVPSAATIIAIDTVGPNTPYHNPRPAPYQHTIPIGPISSSPITRLQLRRQHNISGHSHRFDSHLIRPTFAPEVTSLTKVPPPGVHAPVFRSILNSITDNQNRVASRLEFTSNCKMNGHFAIQNHRFSGAILHYLCISNRKFKKKSAFRLQFAVPSEAAYCSIPVVRARRSCAVCS